MQKQQHKSKAKYSNSKKQKPETNQKVEKQKQIKKAKPIKGAEQMPTIKDMLDIKKQQRQAKSTFYFKKIKPFLESYLQKKQGSRVTQLIFKWGSPQIKSQIHRTIVDHWKQLIKSKYALFMISKVSVDYDFPRIVDDAVLLQNNSQGSMVLQNYLNKHPGAEKAILIQKKFEEIEKQSKQKGFQSQQVLHNLAMKSIEKEYYNNKISKLIIRLGFPTMVDEEKSKVLEFFKDKVYTTLFRDDQGVKLFIKIYNYYDSKQRKIIVRSLKGNVYEVLGYCKLAYVGIVKLLTETDDTVMVGNQIIPQLLYSLEGNQQNIQQENMQDENQANQAATAEKQRLKTLFNILTSLLSPRQNNLNCLGKIEKTVAFTTCKKSEETRKQQIRNYIYPSLVEYVTKAQNIKAMCSEPQESKVMLGLIKSMQLDSCSELKNFSIRVLAFFQSDLEQKQMKGSKKIKIAESLAADNFGSKILKNIFLLQEPYIDKYCDKFSEIFKKNLEEALNSNASFVITSLVEKGRDQLIEEIKKSKINLTKVKAADFYQKKISQKQK